MKLENCSNTLLATWKISDFSLRTEMSKKESDRVTYTFFLNDSDYRVVISKIPNVERQEWEVYCGSPCKR